MDHYKQLDFMLDSLLHETDDIEIKEYTKFSSGKKIIDENGDYMIIYYHKEIGRVVYTFKGAEDIYFTLSIP